MSKMQYINLTPHVVNDAFSGVVYQPSGHLARVSSEQEEVTAGHFLVKFGQAEGLPEPRKGVLLIVSALVRTQSPNRGDVVSPVELVRSADGQPVGCKGFNVNPGFYAHITGGKFSSREEEQSYFEHLDALRS